jgi:hypothetical protein
MISMSDGALETVTRGNQKRYVAMESWLGAELLSADIPIAHGDGREDVDRSLAVPERLTFTVPRIDRGVSWSPVDDLHPLATNGQRLRLLVGVGVEFGDVEWLQRGWYVIGKSTADGDTVTVEAGGLLSQIQEARLPWPYQPNGATFKAAVRALIEPQLTVVFDAAIVDRAMPFGLNYEGDRLDAVNSILDAWPAEGHVTEEGYYLVAPVADPTVGVFTLTNGSGGTVINATGGSTREGAYNMVVASGLTSDSATVLGAAYDFSTGPRRFGGEFNYLPVPYFFDSPLIETQDQAHKAAVSRLKSLKRTNSLTFQAEIVPHPGLQTGDRGTITTDDHTDLPVVIEALSLPITPGGGSETLTLRSV